MEYLEQLYLLIRPDKFHILKFIIEAYDNLGIISSQDRKKGLVLLRYNSECSFEIMEVLASLAPKLKQFNSNNSL